MRFGKYKVPTVSLLGPIIGCAVGAKVIETGANMVAGAFDSLSNMFGNKDTDKSKKKSKKK